MASMPRGEPRTVPDPDGDLYDNEMAKVRAKREAEDRGFRVSRPTTLQSLIPVVGPAWEAAADVQDGNYAGAAFNGAMAVVDVLPAGIAVKGVRAASKGIGAWKTGSLTARAAASKMKRAGVVKPGQEIHHTIPLNGTSRSAQDPRNHFAFLKPMEKEQHRRLTGSWQGKPQYDPIRRIWYGTNDWQKVAPVAVAASAADGVDAAKRRQTPRR